MASFLQKNNPWIESTILYAASFQDGDDNDDNPEDKEIEEEEEEEEEPRTENTIPSGLLPSPPKRRHGIINNNGSNNVVVNPIPPSRRGKIVQVIQRGGDFDWQRTQQISRLGNGDDDDYCPPYLVIHDGQHSIIAFLSPTTLEGIASSSTIISNRSLVSITNYTVSTILQCCQKQIPCQHQQQRSHQQQQQQQQQSFDFEMHSQILSHLYFTTCNHHSMANSSRNTYHNHNHHHHEPNGYTLIPPEIQSQLPHQITNHQLYLCLYIQGQVSMIGAENQGLIGHPKDVHCSPKLRRELMKLEEEKEEEDLRENTQRKVREDSYSHHVLIMKLEAVHRYYHLLDQKKNGNKEVVTTVDDDDNDDDDDGEDDDDYDNDVEGEGERQGHPRQGRGGGIIRGGKTRKQFGRRGRKKRDKNDHARRRVATRSQTYHSTTLSTKSIPTNSAISVWPWKSRSSVESRSFTSTRDAAASRDAADDSDHEDESEEIVSAMLMMQNSRPGKDGSATAVNGGEEEQPGMNAAVSQTRARGGDIPITEATTPTTTASTPRPPMGNVQELFELGVDIEEFLGLESQSDSDDNAVSAAAATTTTISAAADVGDGNDDYDIDIEEREVVEDETIDKIAGRHKVLETFATRQQQQQRRRQHKSPGRESTCSSTQGTGHESSFVGINDMLVDEDSDAMEDNGGDEQNDENRDEIIFEDGGDNYDDLDESEQIFQTQPESLANYNETRNNNRIGARKTVEALEYQIPLSTTRKKGADQQQLADMGAEVVVTGLSTRRNPTRKKKSRRRRMEDEDEEEDNYPIPLSQRKPPPETLECITMESQISPRSQREASNAPYASEGEKEHEEEDEYPIPLSQRKAPPEAPRGRIVLESQIPLPPRMASKEPVARVGEEEDDEEEDSEAENRAVGRQSQIPISTKTRPVQYSRKKPNNSAASITTPSKVSRKETRNSEDEDFSDDNWMRVRKSTKQCDRDDSDDEDSNDWMKVRQTTKQNKRHHTTEDDNNFVDDDIDFDNVVEDDVDDDSSDEAYEPESQVAGEGSEEIVPPTSLRIMPTSKREARGKRVNEYPRNHVRFAKNPSTEGKYDVTAFSSKASIMLGFASSKKSIQKKVGQKKARGEQFDVASFVDKAQRLCGL